ncbi:MAG: methyltransferase family protein [Planctomycetota bacterium]
MNLIHWTVALITSFSGFFFSREAANSTPVLLLTANVLIISALFLGIATALILGRSYDFLPALRRVRTEFLYQIVRHPMYLSSIIIKLGYVLKNPSVYNALLLVLINEQSTKKILCRMTIHMWTTCSKSSIALYPEYIELAGQAIARLIAQPSLFCAPAFKKPLQQLPAFGLQHAGCNLHPMI